MSKETKPSIISERAIQLSRLLPIITALILLPDQGDEYQMVRNLLTGVFLALSTFPDHDIEGVLYKLGEIAHVIETPHSIAIEKGLPPASSYATLNKQWRGTKKNSEPTNEVDLLEKLRLKDLLVTIINYQDDNAGTQLVALSDELRREFTRRVALENHFQHGSFSPDVRMDTEVSVDDLAPPLQAFLENVTYQNFTTDLFQAEIAVNQAKAALSQVSQKAYSPDEIAVEVAAVSTDYKVPVVLHHNGKIPELAEKTTPAFIALNCITQLYEMGQKLLASSAETTVTTYLSVHLDPARLFKSYKGINKEEKRAAFSAFIQDFTSNLNDQLRRDLFTCPECKVIAKFNESGNLITFSLSLTSIPESQVKSHDGSYIRTVPQNLADSLIRRFTMLEVRNGINLKMLP